MPLETGDGHLELHSICESCIMSIHESGDMNIEEEFPNVVI